MVQKKVSLCQIEYGSQFTKYFTRSFKTCACQVEIYLRNFNRYKYNHGLEEGNFVSNRILLFNNIYMLLLVIDMCLCKCSIILA